ncbi:Xaa-Pro dipeptidyl-peptidase [Pendulispora brunnea]|uniref:Xaa-Pro dipeptidyl-peptidase n=1 Tax=Pendulispora brunnea TaxID=2905690 RepID=A0ABZ2K623_9BACT
MAHLKIDILAARAARLAAVSGLPLVLASCSGADADETQASGGAHVLERVTESTPIYSYADAVREAVWVETTLDNDGDGKPDKVAVDIVRPRLPAGDTTKVPVILEASPYYSNRGRGNEAELKSYDASGVIRKMPLYYDNYFVPRGYAFIGVDLAGTNRSTGCLDVGGKEEILATKAVIDWLNGRATARRANGTAVVADWTTGKVGMIGKSWDGTIANGVAATGVDGLATIVPIAGISSWYVYVRANGTLRGSNRMSGLATSMSGRPSGVCDAQTRALRTGQDDATGNYNDFYAQRDYIPDVSKVRASVFVVHGLNDWNVTPHQFGPWWNALAARNVPRKIWLPQVAHVDPFDFRREEWVNTLHRWFDHWLLGLDNGIMQEPMASVERAPGMWTDDAVWPAQGVHTESLALGIGDGRTGTIGGLPSSTEVAPVRTFTDVPSLTEADATSSPNTSKNGRLVFLSQKLTRAIRISGAANVKLRIRANKPTTEFTARLVDYGSASRNLSFRSGVDGIVNLTTSSCWGESSTGDDACYKDTKLDVSNTDYGVITRGWLDAAHRDSLRNPTSLNSSTWYEVVVPLDVDDAVIDAGHVLGLVIVASDRELTAPQTTGATIDVDLATSTLRLPIVDTGATSVSAREVLAPAEDATAPVAPWIHAPRPTDWPDSFDPTATFY